MQNKLHYKINIIEKLKEKGITYSTCRKTNAPFSQSTLTKFANFEPVNWRNLEKLCEILSLNIGDILEYSNDFKINDNKKCILHDTINTKSSTGEVLISILLNNFKIPYYPQIKFDTCKNPETNYHFIFDFFINDSYLIEFDGEQHFHGTSGWNTEENYLKVKKHDEYKNQWCKNNNIPLIRIPYTKLDSLCIEDLMLETTQFRVV